MNETSEIYKALANVKSKLKAVTKGSDNPYFKSKYADLNTHLDAVEPLLEENGLILLQPVTADENGNVVNSQIVHVKSGQFVSSSMRLVGETDMQKAGSGVTYARRYTLGALLSMKAEDDDGNLVSDKVTKKAATSTGSNKKRSTFPRSTKKVETTTEVGDDI